MVLVEIDSEVSDDRFTKVQALLDYIAIHDVNYGGVEFKLQRGDATSIEWGSNLIAATRLHGWIVEIIQGEAIED